MTEIYANDYESIITSGAMNDSDVTTAITLNTALPTELQRTGWNARIDDEMVRCTTYTDSTSITITRASEDSTRFPKATHGANAVLSHVLTKSGMDNLFGATRPIFDIPDLRNLYLPGSQYDSDLIWLDMGPDTVDMTKAGTPTRISMDVTDMHPWKTRGLPGGITYRVANTALHESASGPTGAFTLFFIFRHDRNSSATEEMFGDKSSANHLQLKFWSQGGKGAEQRIGWVWGGTETSAYHVRDYAGAGDTYLYAISADGVSTSLDYAIFSVDAAEANDVNSWVGQLSNSGTVTGLGTAPALSGSGWYVGSGFTNYSNTTVFALAVCNAYHPLNQMIEEAKRFIPIITVSNTPMHNVTGDTLYFGESPSGGNSAPDTNLYRSAANTLKTDDMLIADLGLGVGNSASATTPGTVTNKIQVFDASGSSLGYIAVYDAIT